LRSMAYDDGALPIEEGQTISQPFIVAEMAAAAELTPDSRVLEIGAGSGYGAAVLSRIAGEVWTIENHQRLADQAAERLAALGYDNVRVIHGDGSRGVRAGAPYDAIVVTAAAPEVPPELVDQLVDGGRLIVPVGPSGGIQHLRRIRRQGDATTDEDLGAVRFVPLV
ncbi:MAG: protein-L-isoaspartate(D-aspartate) O-methyltransferase, partial [Acidimicrobiia bacterium]|nr:protein-L-isoaspartate(D-aspartate) O-methyltransferase [Acidimicrobiia bacterium]